MYIKKKNIGKGRRSLYLFKWHIYLNGKGMRTIDYTQYYHLIVNLPMTARVFSFASKLNPTTFPPMLSPTPQKVVL